MPDVGTTSKPKRGEIELAKFGGRQLPDFYETVPAYLVGALAVHKNNERKWPWEISHIETGMSVPGAYGRTLNEAMRVARALDGGIDWSKIRRGKIIGARPAGLTKKRGEAIHEMVQSFSFLRKKSEHA